MFKMLVISYTILLRILFCMYSSCRTTYDHILIDSYRGGFSLSWNQQTSIDYSRNPIKSIILNLNVSFAK